MRVTLLSQWFDPEPGALRGLPLARELTRLGMDVEVVTGFPNYPGGRVYPGYRVRPWTREVVDGVPVLRVALIPSHDRNPLWRVANYGSFAISAAVLGPMLTAPADVLYVYHPPATIGAAGALFGRLHRVPIVYHIADMWPESVVESGMLGRGIVSSTVESILDVYCRWVYRESSAITVLSPGFKRLLMERGVPGEKVHVIYNWADDDVFRPVARDEQLARELGMEGKFNVVYAGNLGVFQGLETLIRAAAQVTRVPDLQVVFVGAGLEEERLKALASQLRLDNVRFVSRRPAAEMPRLNALADVLVTHLRDLPFFSATVPSKTQVALASARPTIMAVRGDAADLINRAGAGIVVAPDDPDELARAMLQLRSMSREDREQLGANGRAFYLRELSLSVGAARTAQLLREVASRAKHRS